VCACGARHERSPISRALAAAGARRGAQSGGGAPLASAEDKGALSRLPTANAPPTQQARQHAAPQPRALRKPPSAPQAHTHTHTKQANETREHNHRPPPSSPWPRRWALGASRRRRPAWQQHRCDVAAHSSGSRVGRRARERATERAAGKALLFPLSTDVPPSFAAFATRARDHSHNTHAAPGHPAAAAPPSAAAAPAAARGGARRAPRDQLRGQRAALHLAQGRHARVDRQEAR
jgi:hypothetical protein